MTIREIIIQKRTEVGMTQMELSEKTGITQARISDFESSKRSMTSDNIDKILNALELHFKQSREQQWDFSIECARLLLKKGITDISNLSKEEVATLTGKEEIIALKEYNKELYDALSLRGTIDEYNTWNMMKTLIKFQLTIEKKIAD